MSKNAVPRAMTTIARSAYSPAFLHRLFTEVYPPKSDVRGRLIVRAMLINLNLTENCAICHVMAVMSYGLNDLNVYSLFYFANRFLKIWKAG